VRVEAKARAEVVEASNATAETRTEAKYKLEPKFKLKAAKRPEVNHSVLY
jgi:hypothetical protein